MGDGSGREPPLRSTPAAAAGRPTRTTKPPEPCAPGRAPSPAGRRRCRNMKLRLRAYSTHGVPLTGRGVPAQKKNPRRSVLRTKCRSGSRACRPWLGRLAFGIGNFPHFRVEAQLIRRLDRVVVLHQQARSSPVRCPGKAQRRNFPGWAPADGRLPSSSTSRIRGRLQRATLPGSRRRLGAWGFRRAPRARKRAGRSRAPGLLRPVNPQSSPNSAQRRGVPAGAQAQAIAPDPAEERKS